jgi:glyoxylase-like metal-dependent hydrolase (beta-lactamase superfamily II)
MPFALDHINLWAIRDGEGWSVVDTGLRSVEVAEAWHRLLAPEGALGGRAVTRVLATHMHPDHVGMAGWLARRYDCMLWMTRLEYLSCRVMSSDSGREAPLEAIRFYHRAGWSEYDLDHYRTRFGAFGKMIHLLPDSIERLSDRQILQIGEHEWEVVIGRGHSPEHACLYCKELDVLISGDQVLPKITSNTSVFPTEPNADPLRDWLESCDELRRRVSDAALVLPAHNEPFLGLHTRLEQLSASAMKGLARVRQNLDQPRRVIDLVHALFRSSVTAEPMQLSLATGETIAQLNYLRHKGEVVVERDQTGVAWYKLT